MQPNTDPNIEVRVESKPSLAARLNKIATYIFFIMIVLTPLIFSPSKYLTMDIAKTAVIALGTLISAILLAYGYFKERRISLPSRSFFYTGLLLAITAVLSSIYSIHFAKSMFGQGFELGTAAYLMIFLVLALLAYEIVRKDEKKAFTMFTLVSIVFLAFVVLHVVRMIGGPGVLSLGVLNQMTDSLIGKWYELAIFAIIVLSLVVSALATLPLSKKLKIVYYVIGVIAFLTAFLVNHAMTWLAAAVIFAIVSIIMFRNTSKTNGGFIGFVKRISILPAVLLVLSVILYTYGGSIMDKTGLVKKTHTEYAELSLPWQIGVDILAGSLKNYPAFGVGPNHFAQAFMTYKPQGWNQTSLWPVEFNTSTGLIPTYFTTLGGVGSILWILFYIFLAAALVKLAKRFPESPEKRFMLIASGSVTLFLWFMALVYSPSHTIVFLTFIFTGIFLALMVQDGILREYTFAGEGRVGKIVFPVLVVLFVIASVYGLITYGKKTIALGYMSKGFAMVDKQDFDGSLVMFNKALAYDESDVYWQAIAESDRMKASNLISTATSSSDALVTTVSNLISDGLKASINAFNYDKTNYYNLLSQARISQLGAGLKIPKAYDNAVASYAGAIQVNPLNPSLYVSLAQLQAANGNYDQALQTLGSVLQVKSNYLDAVFLLSQVHAARGDLNNAIIAAQVAIQLNPSNPLLYFQLGLLEYNAQNWQLAGKSFAKALELQPDYANAKYFLGLSAVRANDIALAITQFDDLSKANPGNQEVEFILNNLRAGKSPFASTDTSSAPKQPEKRASLPIKETR